MSPFASDPQDMASQNFFDTFCLPWGFLIIRYLKGLYVQFQVSLDAKMIMPGTTLETIVLQVGIRFNLFSKLIILNWGFLYMFLLQEKNVGIIRFNNFFTFQGYRCELDIAIFHGRSLEITLTVPLILH